MPIVPTMARLGVVRSSVVSLVLLLIAAAGAAPRAAAQGPALPPAPRDIATSHRSILLVLPDSGGFAINHQPILLKELEGQLKAIFDARPTKALLVRYHPGARSADLRMVQTIANRLGIKLYAAT